MRARNRVQNRQKNVADCRLRFERQLSQLQLRRDDNARSLQSNRRLASLEIRRSQVLSASLRAERPRIRFGD